MLSKRRVAGHTGRLVVVSSTDDREFTATKSRLDIHNSGVPVLCRSCEARHKGLCGALDARQLTELATHTRQTHHAAGEELIGEGGEVTSYANVMNGVIKLTKGLQDGRQQIVGLQFAPDFLGRLFEPNSKVTAEAASDVDLCKIPKSALEKLIEQNPALERRLLMQTLRELDEARDWMMTLGRKSAAEKVASLIYLIVTRIDPGTAASNENSCHIDLPLTRTDIADFLGLTIETVSRQLTKLRRDKVILIVNYRHLIIDDLARLRARCD